MQLPTQPLRSNVFTRFTLRSTFGLVMYMSVCAFTIYTCMYGFRKPYTVATFGTLTFLGINYKVCLVIAQVLGYMLSKFYGIRFISNMVPSKRVGYIILCILFAWISLLLFALIPAPYNIICLFLNGLPLGMVFGLVFGFLEGRRTTEIMGAFMVTSFIFASGLAKTVGKSLLLYTDVNEWWMPFTAGAFFVIPLICFVLLLSQAPPPNESDISERALRKPMNKQERKVFLQQFGNLMVPVVIAYALFTIVRDFCEDFANDLWKETGYDNNAGIFTQISTITSVVVVIIIGSFFLFRNNFKAFKATHYLVVAGLMISIVATLLYQLTAYSPVIWMLMATSGLYLAYLPFNCLYFERMLSSYRLNANVGFVMYIADAFGYLGTVLVLLLKEFVHFQNNWSSFFCSLFYIAGSAGIVLVLYALYHHTLLFKKLQLK